MNYTTLHSNMMQPEDLSAVDHKSQNQSDRGLLVSVVVLMVFGLLAVYSAISFFAASKGLAPERLVLGHLSKALITVLAIVLLSKIDYRKLLKFSSVFLLFTWALLIYLHFFGETVFGARRWITIGGLTIQPSTLATVGLLMRLSHMIATKQDYIGSFAAFTSTMFWIATTCGLIALQDFSSAAILFMIALLMLFVGRMNILYLLGIIAFGMLGGSMVVLDSPERISRIESYVHQVVDIPDEEILKGNGYQGQQAQIAIARGAVFGVGIGKSAQRDFLPAPYNDFIFAIIAEEYGLIGSGLLLMIYVYILFRGLVIAAKKATDTEGTILALGCTLVISLYAFVNAAVATGLLPVTGLPMPFVSYGGTNMLVAGVLIGIILNISKGLSIQKSYGSFSYKHTAKGGFVNG